jgi:hypothetical protein
MAFTLFYWRISFKSSLSQARNTVHSQSCEKYCVHFTLGLTFCNFSSFFCLFCILCIYVEERTTGSRRKGFSSSHIEKVLMPRRYPTCSAQSSGQNQQINYTDSHLFWDRVHTDHRVENITYNGRNPSTTRRNFMLFITHILCRMMFP